MNTDNSLINKYHVTIFSCTFVKSFLKLLYIALGGMEYFSLYKKIFFCKIFVILTIDCYNKIVFDSINIL